MKTPRNPFRPIGLIAALPLACSISCVPTFEKSARPPEAPAIAPFEEIRVDFEHRWTETTHPFSGAAVIDVDQNGSMELFVGGGEGQQDALLSYRDGRLVDVIEETGLSHHSATHGATSIDLDHDGDTDLLVARNDGVYLHTNANGVFTTRKIPVELEDDAVPFGIAVSDINHDGLGDLYVSTFVSIHAFKSATFNDPDHAKHNVMLLNNGDGTFTDITRSSGTASLQNTFLSVFVDLDGDGWQDLVVAQNTGQVEIFRNLGNLTFTPVDTHSGYGFWMGLAVGDVDHDGDQDLFFSNVGTSIPAFLTTGDLTESQRHESGWLLLRNDGGFTFTNVTEAYGLDGYGFGWGAVFEDIDLDGSLDLLVAENYIKWPLHKLRKLPGKAFLQLEDSSGGRAFFHIDGLGLNNPHFGQTPVILDLDGDAKPDVVWLNMSGPLRAFLNRSENNCIGVVLPDDVHSLGTRVTVETSGGRTYTREAVSSVGLMSDQTSTLFFGLGKSKRVEKVSVRPVEGAVKVIAHPHINQNLLVD